jgi:tRNA-dihydrouridine synthase 2
MDETCRPRLDYKGKLILAPMVKIGTLPTRLLALEYGADIVYTEELIDWRLLNSNRIVNELLGTVDYIDNTDNSLVFRTCEKERGHLVLQIGTSNGDRAAQVAQKMEQDIDGIDVNMGCPKSFSLKGGMGAALLSHPNKIVDILSKLKASVKIPVTCKIRLLSSLEKTIELVRTIEKTGVEAIGVHGRTKDQRPNHSNNTDAIRIISESTSLTVIANGGSSNNRNSKENTHEGIRDFWSRSGASSVMIARAAEWNLSVFREGEKDDIMVVIDRYLDLAIQFDYPFVMVKYCVQQMMGSLQDTPQGREFLEASTMGDVYFRRFNFRSDSNY